MKRYRELINAVILQAVKDYRLSLRILKQQPDSRPAATMKADVEEFFHSDWFGMMTKIDPDYLIDRLRKEAEE
jgi:hypothetical protein